MVVRLPSAPVPLTRCGVRGLTVSCNKFLHGRLDVDGIDPFVPQQVDDPPPQGFDASSRDGLFLQDRATETRTGQFAREVGAQGAQARDARVDVVQLAQ